MARTPQTPATPRPNSHKVVLKFTTKHMQPMASSPHKIDKAQSLKRRTIRPAPPKTMTPKLDVPRTSTASRVCVGCHETLPAHLFLAVNLVNNEDYKEKCFRCRRVDAVQDCIKTYGKVTSGKLSLTAQLDHIEMQEDIGKKWQRKLNHRGFEICNDYLIEGKQSVPVLNAVKKHVALQDAVQSIPVRGSQVQLKNSDRVAGSRLEPDFPLVKMSKPIAPGTSCARKMPIQLPPQAFEAPHAILRSRTEVVRSQYGRFATTAAALRHAASLLDRAETLSDGATDWVLSAGSIGSFFAPDKVTRLTQGLHERIEIASQADFRFNLQASAGAHGMEQMEKDAICTLFAMDKLDQSRR